ncbi:SDR family oxidoreductase [Streptomyces kaniharaensis]|uniref:SDR family oxidoreductase n=1 Tax=Streptomyces kaniharaensis TaxID=212423 RepID=A0A6N7L3S7_9ACTN|nr:SDR family oxidoreductase [Streptomyces kaniharaensis]
MAARAPHARDRAARDGRTPRPGRRPAGPRPRAGHHAHARADGVGLTPRLPADPDRPTRTRTCTGRAAACSAALQTVVRLQAQAARAAAAAGNPEPAEEAVQAIEKVGGSAVAVKADVADEAEVAALFDAAEERFGGADVVVHTAGMSRPAHPMLLRRGLPAARPALHRRRGGSHDS